MASDVLSRVAEDCDEAHRDGSAVCGVNDGVSIGASESGAGIASSLSWHFLLKDRFPARVPTSLAVGAVGPFRPRFRRQSSHLVRRGQAGWQLRGVRLPDSGQVAGGSAVSGTGRD
jgi:hypothetical protein